MNTVSEALKAAEKALDNFVCPNENLCGSTDCKEARSALAQIRAALSTMGWQPMESAPKDGTEVLMAFKYSRPMLVEWVNDQYSKRPRPHWRSWNLDITTCRKLEPLGWMSVPPSPAIPEVGNE